MASDVNTFILGKRSHHACQPPSAARLGRGTRWSCPECDRAFIIIMSHRWEHDAERNIDHNGPIYA